MLDESSPLFIGLTSLSYLGLAANQIQSVSRHAFDGLDALRHVDVTDNDIGSLQDDTFTRLNNLQTMSVSPWTFSLCPSVWTTGSSLLNTVEDTEDSKPKNGRR